MQFGQKVGRGRGENILFQHHLNNGWQWKVPSLKIFHTQGEMTSQSTSPPPTQAVLQSLINEWWVIDRGTGRSIWGGERPKLGHPAVKTIHLSAWSLMFNLDRKRRGGNEAVERESCWKKICSWVTKETSRVEKKVLRGYGGRTKGREKRKCGKKRWQGRTSYKRKIRVHKERIEGKRVLERLGRYSIIQNK